jgi:hemolysin activation/secretion protein
MFCGRKSPAVWVAMCYRVFSSLTGCGTRVVWILAIVFERSRSVSLGGGLGLALASVIVLAAQPPNAGTVLQGIPTPPHLPAKPATALPQEPAPPAIPANAGLRVLVKGFRITGVHAFPEAELQRLLADSIGKELNLGQLQELAARITRFYHEHGYLLARAYLPAQDIVGGVVEIRVLEGRLGKLKIRNESLLGDASARRALAGLREGEAIKGETLERRLLLLNDMPGTTVRSTLKPGATVGSTDLEVDVNSTQRVTGDVEIDNYGSRFTGDVRLGGGVTVNEPAGLGDSLSLRGLAAAGTDYASVAYQLPVAVQDARLGVAISSLTYKLGEDFAPLHAHGTADIDTLYVLYPLVRSRITNLNLQLTYDHRNLDDRQDATATVSDRHIGVWMLSASGDRIDGLAGGGLWNWSLAYVDGSLRLDAVSQALDAAGLDTQGSYGKTTVQLARLQQLTTRLNLYAQVSAQVARKNLDSSEKMILGGALGVRAYPQGEATCDDAVLANLELRYALAADWQLIGFIDAAGGSISHSPLAGTSDNRRSLSGAGLGLTWIRTADFSLQSFLAWRTGSPATSDVDRSPRVWIQIAKYI